MEPTITRRPSGPARTEGVLPPFQAACCCVAGLAGPTTAFRPRHRVGAVAGDGWGRDRSGVPGAVRCGDRWNSRPAMGEEPAMDGERRGSAATRARGWLPSTQISNQAHPARINKTEGTATRRAPAMRRIGSMTCVNRSPAVETSRLTAQGVCPTNVQTSPTRPARDRMMRMRRITVHLRPAWQVA